MFETLQAAADLEGSWKLGRLIGLHKLAKWFLGWRSVHMLRGLQFFTDRSELDQPWPEFINSVKETAPIYESSGVGFLSRLGLPTSFRFLKNHPL